MTARESAVVAALTAHLVGFDLDPDWCICGWRGPGEFTHDAYQAHVAAAVLAALDTTPRPLTLATVEAAVRKWVPASEALVEKVMAELAGAVVESQPALSDDEREALCICDWDGPILPEGTHSLRCSQHRARIEAVLAAHAHQPTPPAQAEAVAAVERVRARFTSCWCCEAVTQDTTDPRSEDCPLHGSGLAQHMAAAALDALPLAPTATAQVTAARATEADQ